MLHLLTFTEIYKERIWGARNLERLFNKPIPKDVLIGESWELVDLPDDKSVVNVGPAAGKSRTQLIKEWKTDLLGEAGLEDGQFPLLIKLLDAQDTLSVQIHPDYEGAKALGGGAIRPKYESWYVMEAQPGAFLYIGLKPGTDLNMVRRAVEDGTLENLLVKVPVKKGDFYYLPGGTVHAIGAGLVIAEVQTPSDTTFRLYDWNRVDAKTGKPRQLHVEQAIQCIRLENQAEAKKLQPGQNRIQLACAPTFCVSEVMSGAGETIDIQTGQTIAWVIISGSGTMTDGNVRIDLKPGKTVLIPAHLKSARADFTSQTTLLEVRLTS